MSLGISFLRSLRAFSTPLLRRERNILGGGGQVGCLFHCLEELLRLAPFFLLLSSASLCNLVIPLEKRREENGVW